MKNIIIMLFYILFHQIYKHYEIFNILIKKVFQIHLPFHIL